MGKLRAASLITEGGYALVIASGDEYAGRKGKVLSVDVMGGTTWVSLDIDGDEVTFAATELDPVGE